MREKIPPSADLGTLWDVRSYDFHQRVEPNGRWWFENKNRERKGVAILQYSLRGKMLYRDRRGEREVPAGWAALFLLGEESAYGCPAQIRDPYLTQHVSFSGAGLPEHCNLIRERFGSVFHLGEGNPLRRAMRRLCERERPRSAAEAALVAAEIYAFLMRLFASLETQSAREKPPVERALDEILSQPAATWSMKEVAARHGCSREHLTRVFAARQGQPPARFLARSKLAKALELLRETSLPLERVAEQSGFASTHTLARWVRRATGNSPGVYRTEVERH